jgi:hypothetical protein
MIAKPGLFDAVVDFDAATIDQQTGELRPEFIPSSTGGPGDKVSLNRPGYLAMGNAVELRQLAPVIVRPRPRSRTVAKPQEAPASVAPGISG